MNAIDPTASDPAAWAVGAGLAGASELELLRGFCERAVAGGLPVSRAQLLIDTLHPIHEGRVFRWGRTAPPRSSNTAARTPGITGAAEAVRPQRDGPSAEETEG